MKRFLLIIAVFLLVLGIIGSNVFLHSIGNPKTLIGEKAYFSHLSPEEFNNTLSSGQYKLLDIRTQDEYGAGHIKGASQIDYYQTQDFSDYLDALDKNEHFLVYCATGRRSAAALQIMQQKGFAKVYDLEGGYNAWLKAGFPTEQ